ncbi:MAG TPA: enoyl-CoA hydratase/isomerase family protein [Chloroflexota bacterium]|nr:enoyl-CoA hydratase/isomerase family protein [Chloroflexota bacterium]
MNTPEAPIAELPLLVERRGRVGIATMNRPAKLNAMSTHMLLLLEDALRNFEADDGVGAVVIAGAGERAFSAGRDLGEATSAGEPSMEGRIPRAPATLGQCSKPTIAAVRGYCYGGGALLALGCDVRLAAQDARFKFPGAAYGLPAGGVQLARVVGPAKAKELLFTGDVLDAAEALRIGLVNQVLPNGEELGCAIAMAERMASNSPAALAALKEVVDLTIPVQQALAHEAEVNRRLRASGDTATRLRSAAERVTGQRPA